MGKRSIIEKALEKGNGILNLEPAWVCRDFLPPGKRLGLKEEEYYCGERGYICERWLGSVTYADNKFGPEDEGLSYLRLDNNKKITLKEALEVAGDLVLGGEYYRSHKSIGRLAKIFDYSERLPYHLHQMKDDAVLVGKNPKEEAYYFIEGADTGKHPETFFGVHPYIAAQKKYDILLPYLKEWNSDLILRHSRAYLNVTGEGFHLPAGVLHAPGTALTIELQEDSDVFSMLQALNGGKIISKDLLYKDIRQEDIKKYGERVILNQVNWEISGDPYFYENRHTNPRLIEESKQKGGEEYWIFYNTTKFSGKKLVVKPGGTFKSVENGVYSIFAVKGKGKIDGHEIEAGNFKCDEYIVSHERAVRLLTVKNDGKEDLVIIKFFGPDINMNTPVIKKPDCNL